ncbi:hypothetical protein M8J77_006622 [Diaphorina citri]|nr:hypothetical protein M8J77_006622 [Diaphorina citri]
MTNALKESAAPKTLLNFSDQLETYVECTSSQWITEGNITSGYLVSGWITIWAIVLLVFLGLTKTEGGRVTPPSLKTFAVIMRRYTVAPLPNNTSKSLLTSSCEKCKNVFMANTRSLGVCLYAFKSVFTLFKAGPYDCSYFLLKQSSPLSPSGMHHVTTYQSATYREARWQYDRTFVHY